MGRRRRRRETPLSLTFVVAAVDSRDPYSADYRCNGIADEVEINLALAAPGVAEGVVVLMEGTFTTAASIAFTANNQTLRGQGRSTYINGTGLPAGAHAVVLSGFTNCHIWDLAVETLGGGGDVTHCIFIEDGADDFHVRNVTIVDSDDDGIHVEGTTINIGHIHLCHIETADGDGIHVEMDALNFANRFHVEDCDVVNCAGNGIVFAASGGNDYCTIINNIVFNCPGDSISLTDGDQSLIRGNICIAGGDGVFLGTTINTTVSGNVCQGTTVNGVHLDASTDNSVVGNTCQGNVGAGIQLSGVSSNNSVSGNTCQGNDYGIHVFANSIGNSITGNTCRENTANGIQLSTSTSNSIVGNTFSGNTGHGMEIATASNNTVSGNTCQGNGGHGIFISSSDNNTVSGNTCQGNDSGDTGNFDGINLAACDRILVIGNQCQDHEGWGIQVDNDSNDCKIASNYTNLNVAGSINVNGATCDNNEVVWNTVEEGDIVNTGTLTRASGNFDPSADAYFVPIGALPF